MATDPTTELKPPGQMEEPALVKFVKDRAYRSSPVYAGDFSRWRKSELYDQGDQWLRRAYTTRDSRYPTQWTKMEYNAGDPSSIPLPVYNEMVAIRENESARLGRPEYKPRVRPKGKNPGIAAREGADGGEHALNSRLKEMGWEERQEKLCYHMPMFGGAFLESSWDQTWMDTVRVPAESVICSRNPMSPQYVADATLVPEPIQPAIPGVQLEPPLNLGPSDEPPPLLEEPEEPTPEDVVAAQIGLGAPPGQEQPTAPPAQPPCNYVSRVETASGQAGSPCQTCGQGVLGPYQPTLEEAQGELGKDWPKGDWELKVLSPFCLFVRDSGIEVDQKNIDEWVYVHLETIDWLAERYPDKVRDLTTGELKIHPEHPSTLMAEDPTMGAPTVYANAAYTQVFKKHVVVFEYCRRPWLAWNEEKRVYEKNHGRYTVVVGNRVCIDTDLEVESLNQPGQYVARKRLEYVVWEPRDGGRRTTAGQSLWDRLFDIQDGINTRHAQIRSVNERGAVPWYLQARGRNFETRAADSAVPFRRVLVDIDPVDKIPPLTLMQNTTIDAGVYQELDGDLNVAQRISGQVEVEQGRVPPNIAAATAIAYLKTEAGEKRRPRILRIRQALIRNWEHGLKLMAAFYIEPREYSFEDEMGEERWEFIHGEIIASANPKVDIYPTPDYDATDAKREAIRDMVHLGILNPQQTPQLNRKLVKAMQPDLEFFVDDDLQEDQADREWRDFKEKGKVPIIDPSLDDGVTHFQSHGQQCFGAWFRNLEEQGGWDAALAILGSDWDQTGIMLAMTRPPGTSLQTILFQTWSQRLMQAMQMGLMPPPPNPQALQQVLQWRAHMEAHKLLDLVRSSMMNQQAPGQGSSPTSTNEAPQTAGAGVPM